MIVRDETHPALRATGLGKRYGRDRWALRDIDLSVPSGGITALVGPNAAGKSTLIRTWMGFERPSVGSARVDGVDPARQPGRLSGLVGYVPQSPALYPELRVGDHLRLAALVRPGFDTPRALARLGSVGIEPQQSARALSGGQRAQVALTLALASGARILLLDEPLADLDPLARREFLRALRQAVVGDAMTVLLSSHVVSDIIEACDALIVLGVGRVLLASPIRDALAGHLVVRGDATTSGLVASFLGPDGEELALHRRTTDHVDARPATLEEVVLGYLAFGRQAQRDA